MNLSFKPSLFSILAALFFILSFCYSGSAATQPDLVFEFEFSVEELEISSVHSLSRITLAGCEVSEEVGMPEVPVRSVQIGLPPGTAISAWKVQSLAWQTLPQSLELVPVQPPRILSDPASDNEYQHSYSGSFNPVKPYPAQAGVLVGRGMMNNQSIADFLIYPIRYHAEKKQVELCTHIRLTLSIEQNKSALQSQPGALANREKGLLLNPEVVCSMDTPNKRLSQVLLEGWYEYLIITSDELAASFEPLAEWKTQKGVPAKILTKEQIQAYGFAGDLQAQIRTLIQHAANEWGTLWILLGGDIYQVPERRAYAMDSENGTNANAIPCDLYYADLDGTWNADGDSTYGEIDDNIDLYSDVYVGRAPAKNIVEAQTFVNKVLGYEKAPPVAYATSVLFFSQIEDRSPYTDSSDSMELIDEKYIPPRFDPITKLYESLGNESRDSVFAALQQGHHFVNHTGHAWVGQLSSGSSGQWIRSGDVDLLTNGKRLSIAYSTGCWPGAFDDNCIAERFLNNPNGGGIATIFNSRYGWYAPGNPRFGYSDRFNQLYYKTLLLDDKHHLGEVLAHIKAFYVPRSRSENVYRWHQYMLNLMGDPEMPVWTREPENLTVVCPETVLTGECPFDVLVRSGTGSREWRSNLYPKRKVNPVCTWLPRPIL